MELMDRDAPPDVIDELRRACREAADAILDARRAAAGEIENSLDRAEAERCVMAIRQHAGACAGRNGQIAEECILQIRRLLDDGQLDEALTLARRCILNIRANTADCTRAIHELCHRCLQHLVRNCANALLIHQVKTVCEESIEQVVASARRSIGAIRDILPPPPMDSDPL